MATQSIFPINFDLYDKNEDNVLYITEDIEGQDLTLEVVNSADKPIHLQAPTGDISPENSQFELVFRPGVVFDSNAIIKSESKLFELYYAVDANKSIIPNPDGTISFFFRATSALTLAELEKANIEINQIRAAASGGTRGTRVMLKYRNLYFDGSNEPFTGFKEMHINVVNHQGRMHIPLHVGFVGHNTIVNNGEENQLRLRISNSSRNNKTIESNDLSKLVLAMDAGTNKQEWTTATPTQLEGIEILVEYPGGAVPVEVKRETGSVVWKFDFNGLKEGEFIDVTLNKVKTKHPTGHSNLYLHYENIPGFWDGQYVTVIEKGPLTFDGPYTGLGNATPEAALCIVPKANDRGLEVLSPSAGNTHFPWKNNWNYISGKGIIIRDTAHAERIRINAENGNMSMGSTSTPAKLQINSPADSRGFEVLSASAGNTHFPWKNNWNYISGKGLILRSAKHAEKIRINLENGNMSLGTTDTPAKLHIIPTANGRGLEVISPSAGNTHFPWTNNWNYISGKGLILRNESHQERMRVDLSSGNVGIGTTSPGAKLDVNGNLSTKGLKVNSSQQFNRMLAGHHHCGSHGGGVKEVRINFPQSFSRKPMCVCTIRGEGYYNDTFAVTVKYIDTTHFKVNILRVDSMRAGWGQNLRLDWFAFEM